MFKVAPYIYLKFRVFYATFDLAKFTTNALKIWESDYLGETVKMCEKMTQSRRCHGNHVDLSWDFR